MDKKEVICIVCPKGCHVKVGTDDQGEYTYTGNECKRGPIYVKTELNAPTRMLTTTIPIKNGKLKRLPISSDKALPKDKVFDALKELKNFEVEAPIKSGAVVYKDILGLNINMIAGYSFEKI